MIASIIGRGCFEENGEDVPSIGECLKKKLVSDEPKNGRERLPPIGNVPVPDISHTMGNSKYNRISLNARFAVKTATEALDEAGLSGFKHRDKIGIFTGTAEGPENDTHKFYKFLKTSGYKKGNPLLFPETSPNLPASYVGLAHNITGPMVTILSDLTIGYEVLEAAINYLAYGFIDYALVINSEEISDFVLWYHENKVLADYESETRNWLASDSEPSPFKAGAACLILKNGETLSSKGTIRSVRIGRNPVIEKAISRTVDEVIEAARLTKSEIDLVLIQSEGKLSLREQSTKVLQKVMPHATPVIDLNSILGNHVRKCALLNSIFATFLGENGMLADTSRQNDSDWNKKIHIGSSIRTVLLVSVSQDGRCGALTIDV